MGTASRKLASRYVRPCAVLALLFGMLSMVGCTALVGDACELSTDCGSTLRCETSMPDGYCTAVDCERDGCPDEGVCVRFENDASYCMRRCDSNDDCREAYTCVQEVGAHSFCNDARGLVGGDEG